MILSAAGRRPRAHRHAFHVVQMARELNLHQVDL
jgi:hypothetical protein